MAWRRSRLAGRLQGVDGEQSIIGVVGMLSEMRHGVSMLVPISRATCLLRYRVQRLRRDEVRNAVRSSARSSASDIKQAS